MKYSKLLAFALILPVCVVAALLLLTRKKAPSKPDPRAEHAKTQIAIWDREDFTKIADTGEFRAILMKVPMSSKVDLTKEHEVKLKESIYDFLMAYSVGDYEVYSRFRFPSKGRFNPTHLQYARRYLDKLSKKATSVAIPESEEGIFKQYVNVRSEQTYYKGFFQAASLGRTQVDIDSSPSLPGNLMEYVKGTTNLGVAYYDPMYVFDRSASSVLKEEGTLITATISTFIKTSEPDGTGTPAPFYIRFYWDGQSSKWLVHELATGNIKQKSKVLIVF
jgi:hypothetical protein